MDIIKDVDKKILNELIVSIQGAIHFKLHLILNLTKENETNKKS